MADGTPGDLDPRPPMGSWSRLYALVCVAALSVMALLWWFSAHYNLRMTGN